MITKISKIDSNNYSVNDSEIPIDKTSLINLGINLGVKDIEEFTERLDREGSIELEDKTAGKGSVVNIYEVDYPDTGLDEIQEMQSHLNEKNDLIGQNFFPGVKSEDIVITTEKRIPDNEVIKEPENFVKAGPGRFFTKQELLNYSKKPVLKESSKGRKYIEIEKKGWAEPPISFFKKEIKPGSRTHRLLLALERAPDNTLTTKELDTQSIDTGGFESISKALKHQWIQKINRGKYQLTSGGQYILEAIQKYLKEGDKTGPHSSRESKVFTKGDIFLVIRSFQVEGVESKDYSITVEKGNTLEVQSYFYEYSRYEGYILKILETNKYFRIDKEDLEKLLYKKALQKQSSLKNESNWRQILSNTETETVPTKAPPKPKEPIREPVKEPRPNPFRKPDHIKPSKEPQPKALPVTYPPNTSLKMHPELENTINKKDTPYHALPQVPGNEFIENIASDRFRIILRNLERYSGRRIRSIQDMVPALMNVLQKINNIEQHYTSQLEDLAVSIVEQQFGIDPREVGFDAKLVREVNLEDITNISPQQERQLEEALPNLNIDLEVSKRRFINGLIQGAGINSLSMFHVVDEELSAIDPDLINMYGLLTAFAEIGYWVIPQSMIGSASGGVFGGGKVKLDFSQEEPRIIAVAVNFPILVQELVKGVMELLSSHGLPEDENTREQVLNRADTLEDESWDIRFGPEIWKKLLAHLNINEVDGRALSLLYHNFVKMDAATFSDFVNKILSGDQNSINEWNRMYQEALGQSRTSSFGSEQNEEELLNIYDQYRREKLSKGETPKLYYNWLRNRDLI